MKRDGVVKPGGGKRGAAGRRRLIPRPAVPQGPLRTLKQLIYEAYVAAGAPTLDVMAEAIAEDDDLSACPSRDTINRIIGDASIPAKQADVVALVTALTRHVGGDAEQAGRRAAELWAQSHLAEPLGRPITELDPYDLEVHHGIAMRGTEGLTEYIERDHDAELRQIVHLAAEGRSRMVMLVGSSSCGKTRACYEAIQHLPNNWLLWHPIDPDRPQAALAGLAKVGPKTVIWLNEAHHYLLHPQFGEPIASALRALLTDTTRAPVLVLGTIWPGPGYFDDLLYSPKPGKVDPYSQARVLIADRVLHVPSAFTSHEVAELKWSTDPRLAAAARSAQDGMVTQYLAAGFDLVGIHRQAPPGAKALLDAAIDARRLGHPINLPLPFLAAAAEAYLSDIEWELLPDNWLEDALAQLTNPVKGVPGPLHRQKRPRGATQPASATTGQTYRLADFLVDQARATRGSSPVPELFWQAALTFSEGDAARNLATAAAERGLTDIACRLWAKTSDYLEIALCLARTNRLNEALPWFESAREAGARHVTDLVVQELAQTGRGEDIHLWLEHALQGAEDAETLWSTAQELARAGRLREALPWYQRAAAAGETDALRATAEALADTDQMDAALPWFERAIAAGDSEAFWAAVQRMPLFEQLNESLAWLVRVAPPSDERAFRDLADELAGAERLREAMDWCEEAEPEEAVTALREALRRFATPLRAADGVAAGADNAASNRSPSHEPERFSSSDEELVSTWAARAARRAETRPLASARRLAAAGNLDEALASARQAALAGEPYAATWGALQLADRGRWGEALAWCARAAEAGSGLALDLAVVCLSEQGRAEEAEQLERYGWNASGDIATSWQLNVSGARFIQAASADAAVDE